MINKGLYKYSSNLLFQHVHLHDHDYQSTREDSSTYGLLSDHPDLKHLLEEAATNKRRAEELEDMKNSGVILKLDSLKDNPKLFQYYTGLKYDVFMALFHYLEPKAR